MRNVANKPSAVGGQALQFLQLPVVLLYPFKHLFFNVLQYPFRHFQVVGAKGWWKLSTVYDFVNQFNTPKNIVPDEVKIDDKTDDRCRKKKQP